MTTDTELEKLLGPAATTAERLLGLSMVGIPISTVATLTQAKPSTVRNWSSGKAEPRQPMALLVDDVRAVASVLLRGGLPANRIGAWFRSRDQDFLDGLRPVETVVTDPMRVLSAAHGLLLSEGLAGHEVQLVPEESRTV